MKMIKIALTNLRKYNEGVLVYEWLTLPCEKEEIEAAMKRIGIGEQYEEWFVSDYEAPFHIEEYADVYRLNEKMSKLSEIVGIEGLFHDDWTVQDVISVAWETGNDNMVECIIADEEIDYLVMSAVKDGSWNRVKHLLGGVNMLNEDYYYINGYGNIEDLCQGTVGIIRRDLIEAILNNL
ncbi:anti-restriction protein [Bacillus phage Mgbh1]|uniref:Antirestriction family-like protein n=1 Tax=Bacillus phage Mgbh1 TaxID=1796993 RepID=A0A142F1K6_9CAUD|nr:anti-restriction protein [Bacillus phage Mgbh1]AMQ66663.1 antirestriction family-like protein [Bacillus phage Mgbh1]